MELTILVPVFSRREAIPARRQCGRCTASNYGTEDREIFIEIAGDGFLYNMVRIIAGTLVETGAGREVRIGLPEIIESRRPQEGRPYGRLGRALSERSILR